MNSRREFFKNLGILYGSFVAGTCKQNAPSHDRLSPAVNPSKIISTDTKSKVVVVR